MMHRRTVIGILLSGMLVTSLGFAVWSGQLYLASRAFSAAAQPEVLGASQSSAAPGTDLLNALTTSDPSSTPSATLPALDLKKYPILASTAKLPIINARQYILYHPDSGKVLLEKDSTKPVAIASTTKLMTALLSLKYLKPEDFVTVSANASQQEPSIMGLHRGEQISVKNLLYGLLLVSGNDAAYALGESVGEALLQDSAASSENKVARFVQEMNSQASELKLANFRFQDPAGLNDEGKGTALDLAKLTAYLNRHEPLIKEIATTASIDVTDQKGRFKYQLTNSNRLVAEYQFPGATIGKTGLTSEAGHCLVASAIQSSNPLVAVVLSTYSQDAAASAQEAKKLLEWGYTNYQFE